MKKITLLFMIVCLVFAGTIHTSAAVSTNASSWAVNDINRAVDVGIVPASGVSNAQKNITRREFAEYSVNLYKTLTGKEPVVMITNPFNDINNSKVIMAYQLKIVSGVGNRQFAPNQGITKEQLCVMIVNALKASGVNTTSYTRATAFADESKVSSYALESVRFLKAAGILTGSGNNMLNPKQNVSVQEAVALLVRSYETFVQKPFSFNGVSIQLGDAKSTIEGRLGQPDRTFKSGQGFTWYAYTKDYNKFIMLGYKNNRVAGIYTNANGFNYRSMTWQTTSATIKSRYYVNDTDTKFVFTDYYGTTTLFMDRLGKNNIESILILDKTIATETTQPASDLLSDYEQILFHIINAGRVKNNLSVLSWDAKAYQSAKGHSNDMARYNFEDYTNKAGESAFDRMMKAGITYQQGAENIKSGYKTPMDVYHDWLNTSSNRTNMFNSAMRYTGIGVAASSVRRFYYTQDIYY